MRALGIVVVASVVAACASGSAIVTGQKRPPIADWESVRIMAEMPTGAEQIGLVKASSEDGWTQQGSVDYAVAELKKQAAKIGANAIVLRGQGTTSSIGGIPTYQTGGTGLSGPIIYTTEAEFVEGLAVYLPPVP